MLYCRCCGGQFNDPQQLRRHRLERKRRLVARLNAEAEAENANAGPANLPPNEDPPLPDAGPADYHQPAPNNVPLDDNAPILGNVGQPNDDLAPPVPEDNVPVVDAEMDWRDIDLVALIANEVDKDDDFLDDPDELEFMAGLELEDEDEAFEPPPHLNLRPGGVRNRPVTIEDWDLEGEADFSPPESIVDDAFVAGDRRDPDYVEHDEPLGQNADEEPDMNDEDLLAFLRQIMGNLAEEEWIDIFERESPDSIKNMRHRVKHEAYRAANPGLFEDVFDATAQGALNCVAAYPCQL